MLAKDHKMKDLWQPEMSSAGSKAAMMAHKNGATLDLWHPSASSAGNSAATLAMRNKGLSPQIDRGMTDAGRTNSLLAAAKVHNRGRQRSGSTPVPQHAAYPDSHNSTKNALNAATVSHRTSARNAPDGWDSEANQAARIKNSHMDPKMFGEHPPVEPELNEQKHQAALRASAVSMAKRMYDYQNRDPTPSDGSSGVGPAGAETAHRRNQSSMSTQPDLKEEAMKYIHLQDAAHKLAQERLAKVEREMGPGRYREYYGYPDQSPKKSRLPVRGRGRKRASSEGQYFDDSDDEEQARRIRTQMSQLSTATSTVDNRQRQDDRARLLAAAEKRVHARMHDMDEKVFQETGKVSQSMMDEWEVKAREKAEKDRELRERNPGKTHIGGGKYMDQADIEAIAAARLKPTLDEINDTAEKKRARDEEIKRQRDEQETEKMNEKMKDQQVKAEFKRIKGMCCGVFLRQNTNFKSEQDKADAKREKEERKAAERAEKEQAKVRKSEDARKSRDAKRDEVAAVAGGAALAEVASKVKTDDEDEIHEETHVETEGAARKEPKEEPKDESKEKQSGRGMFDRIVKRLKGRGDDTKQADEPEAADKEIIAEETEKPSTDADDKSEKFYGGATAAGVAAVGVGVAAAAGVDDKRVSKEESRPETPDEGAAIPGVATVGSGLAAAGGVEEERSIKEGEETRIVKDEEQLSSSEEEEEDREPQKGALASAGAAVVGAGVAGAMAVDRAVRGDREEESSEVSSLSTEEDDHHEQLAPITSPEHDGSYNFAMPSPTAERKKPDLERHISTIGDSDSSSDELSDSDDDDDHYLAAQGKPTYLTYGNMTEESTESAQAKEAPVVGPAPVEERPVVDTALVIQEPESPVSPLQVEEEPKILTVNTQAEPDAPHVDLTPRAATPEPRAATPEPRAATPEPRASTPEAAAPAPAVKTGPRDDDPKTSQKESKDKGVRGFLRKLTGRNSKPENKLQKSSKFRAASGASSDKSEKSFQGGAKYTETKEKEKDDLITPVTTTSVGKAEEENLTSEHVGTDGAIGDSKDISGVEGDARASSPSSFKRYDQDLNDPDDVSSSGAEEEDVARGRTGRIAKKLGLAKGKGNEKDAELGRQETRQSGVSKGNGDDEQFEEARDTFDESLAPPPAFAGQAKTESPSRETRFHEQL